MNEERLEIDNANFKKGLVLRDEEVQYLEQDLADAPDARGIHIRLLGFYSNKDSTESLGNWYHHFLWLVDNCPSDWICGARTIPESCSESQVSAIRERWLLQINRDPTNLRIIANAALCLRDKDYLFAKSLFEDLMRMDCDNPTWTSQRAFLCLKNIKSNSNVLSDCEQAIILETERGARFLLLNEMCDYALESKELSRAESYAHSMLRIASEMNVMQDWAYSWLGRIALANGQDETVLNILAEMQELGFSRKMSLPRDLLSAGKDEVVLAYLTALAKNAGIHQEQLQIWIQELRAGNKPTLFDLHPFKSST
jgi:hypothetical protein